MRSHILLGTRGIELPKITQKLETLNARKTFEPLDPIADTDIQGFLKNEKENAILSVIAEVNKNVRNWVATKKCFSFSIIFQFAVLSIGPKSEMGTYNERLEVGKNTSNECAGW